MGLVVSGDQGGRATSPRWSPQLRMEVSKGNLKMRQKKSGFLKSYISIIILLGFSSVQCHNTADCRGCSYICKTLEPDLQELLQIMKSFSRELMCHMFISYLEHKLLRSR